MILDKLENAPRYFSISPDLKVALTYLMEHAQELKTSEDFSIVHLSENVQKKIIQYDTFPHDRKWESHHVFTDIQYMVSGEERVGFAPVELMHSPIKTEGKDQTVWQGDGDRLLLPEGHFLILFPGEAHMSKLAAGEVKTVRKAAFKVRLG